MSYEIRAYLKNTYTGQVVRVRYNVSDSLNEKALAGIELQWTEGDDACDCNRALHFSRALGWEIPEDLPCGRFRFELVALVVEDGEVSHHLLGYNPSRL